ncbi:hypothetical protein BKI52_38970 [marine bacterium AO1-C]|nr:hypothetical protein BKI52_38970 [marine bacterium AO1-C]
MKNLTHSQVFILWIIPCCLLLNTGFKEKYRKNKASFSNGAMAYAYPIEGITIDGDIADWPKNLTRFPIKEKVLYGAPAKNEKDLKAYFQVGYQLSSRSLYMAVVVTDESHQVDHSKEAKWNTQDAYLLYVDKQHLPNGSGVSLYEIGEKLKRIPDPSGSWDPAVKKADWSNVKVVCKRVGNQTIYECQVKLGKYLKAGNTIGVDHIIADKDADDAKGQLSYIAWGKGGGKSRRSGKLGVVFLMEPAAQMGSITGQLAWQDAGLKKYPHKLRFTAEHNPTCWTDVSVNRFGEYAAKLPVGTYKISLVGSIHYENRKRTKIGGYSQQIKVEANQVVKAPIIKLTTMSPPDLIPEKGGLLDFDASKTKAIDQFVKAYLDFYEIPGASLALIKNGKVVYHKAYGTKNIFTGDKVTNKTLFAAGSVTKPVFAFAVCRLAERGIIDLDKPLYQYLPFKAIAHDKRHKFITARFVLSHRTGLPNWIYNKYSKVNLRFTPGTKFSYSGEGFEYLKRVIVKITGKDINTVLQEEVLTPLNMKNTYFKKNKYLAKNVSHGHLDNLPTLTELPQNPGMAWSMHTEAKAFTSFVLGLWHKKGLKPTTYQEMFRHHSKVSYVYLPGWQEYFGLGISMETSPFGPTFGHSGDTGDFKCLFKMYEKLKVGFILFTNSNHGTELNRAIDRYLVTGKLESDKK